MCDELNRLARVDDKHGMMCYFEKLQARPYKGPVLPNMMPVRYKAKRAANSERTGEPCFYLCSGNDHVSGCSEITLSPSGVASYTTDVTWGYRRAPFSGGTAIAGSLSPAKGGGVSDSASLSQAPRGFEVWYQPSTTSTGVTPDSSPTPLPAARLYHSSRSRRQRLLHHRSPCPCPFPLRRPQPLRRRYSRPCTNSL